MMYSTPTNVSHSASPLPTVIVGGGTAGMELVTALAKKLRPTAAQSPLVLVDKELGHVWKPRLHEIATATQDVVSAESSFLSHSKTHGYQFELGRLDSIDFALCAISLAPLLGPDGLTVLPRRDLRYSRLVLALGSDSNDFGIPGVQEFCHFLNSTAQAESIRQRLLALFLRVARGLQPSMSVIVVGGGATGVELAAEIYHSMDRMRTLGPQIQPEQMRMTVIEAGQRVLSSSPPEQSEYAAQMLRARGITLRTSSRVNNVDADGAHLSNGEYIEADLMVWTAGVQGPAVLSKLTGIAISSAGRVRVDGQLQSVNCRGVYALGDCAEWTDPKTGKSAPYTAQVASAQARYLSKVLVQPSTRLPLFRFASKGSVVSLGGQGAVGNLTTRFGQRSKDQLIQGASAKWLYSLLFCRHELAIHGWGRATARFLVERLERSYKPSIKLH